MQYGEPLVSVVMPVYNGERYLDAALSCLERQDMRDFEVIVVDDGSTDSSPQVVRGFCARDERFRYVHQDNAGTAAARNRGMSMAQGRYLSFLDADDLFEPNLLSRMYEAAEASGADVIVCNADEFDDASGATIRILEGHKGLHAGVYDRSAIGDVLFESFQAYPWDKLFRLDLHREHRLEFQHLRHGNDMYFVYMSIAHAKTLAFVDDILVHYRVGSGGSLRDNDAAEPLCDVVALQAIRESLERDGLMTQGLRRCLDSFCADSITGLKIRLAASCAPTLRGFCDSYRDEYEGRWGLDGARWPHIRPVSVDAKHRIVRGLSADGLLWACRRSRRGRSDGDRGPLGKLLLLCRMVMAHTLPGFRS